MPLRWLNLIVSCAATFLIATSMARGQTADPLPVPPNEQNDSFRDTLARMQIQREENEHKKLVSKAGQLREAAGSLAKDAEGGRLPRSSEKKLKEIEKSARQIRSESGGANEDTPLESPPGSLSEAVHQLDSLSERLNASMEKTSRRVVSATVVAEASEVIQLVKIIRTYLN